MDARAEASRLYALGWSDKTVRAFRCCLMALNGWTEYEFEAVATELEGMIG